MAIQNIVKRLCWTEAKAGITRSTRNNTRITKGDEHLTKKVCVKSVSSKKPEWGKKTIAGEKAQIGNYRPQRQDPTTSSTKSSQVGDDVTKRGHIIGLNGKQRGSRHRDVNVENKGEKARGWGKGVQMNPARAVLRQSKLTRDI